MRFMVLVKPSAPCNEEGKMPGKEKVATMMKFNEQLAEAGVLLALDGLHGTAKGARVEFHGGKPSVTDGPFAETRELVGGYWMWNVNSKDDAIAWAKRCPASDGDVLEIRQVFEMSDFAPDSRDEAAEKRVADALAA